MACGGEGGTLAVSVGEIGGVWEEGVDEKRMKEECL